MSFLAKAIDRVQREDGRTLFARAITQYLIIQGAMFYDPRRDLFWVKHPAGDQVAVWMMPFLEEETQL